MAKDIRISTLFVDHPKTMELKELLGPDAVICLVRLWGYAAEYRSKGCLDRMNASRIEAAAKWMGTPGSFVDALMSIGYLEKNGEIFSLHNWREHQGFIYFSKERKKRARKAVAVRWKKHRKRLKEQHDASTTTSITGCTHNVNTPLPSPSPSPIPNIKTGPGGPASGEHKPKSKSKSKKEKIERGLELLILDLNRNMNWRRKASPGLVAKVIKNMALDHDWLAKARQAAPCVSRIDDRRWPGGKVRFEWFFQMYNARREFDPVVDKIIAGAYDMRPAPTKTYAEKEAEEARISKDSKKADPEAVKASIKKAREAVGPLMKDFGKIPEKKQAKE